MSTLKETIERLTHPLVAAIFHDGSWRLVPLTPSELTFQVRYKLPNSTKAHYRNATKADGQPPEGTDENGWQPSSNPRVGDPD